MDSLRLCGSLWRHLAPNLIAVGHQMLEMCNSCQNFEPWITCEPQISRFTIWNHHSRPSHVWFSLLSAWLNKQNYIPSSGKLKGVKLPIFQIHLVAVPRSISSEASWHSLASKQSHLQSMTWFSNMLHLPNNICLFSSMLTWCLLATKHCHVGHMMFTWGTQSWSFSLRSFDLSHPGIDSRRVSDSATS